MEIVGEITDEHDLEVGDAVVSEGDDIWIMEGDVHLDEVEARHRARTAARRRRDGGRHAYRRAGRIAGRRVTR